MRALGIREVADLNGAGADAGAFGPLPHNRFKEVRQGTLSPICAPPGGGPTSPSAPRAWSTAC